MRMLTTRQWLYRLAKFLIIALSVAFFTRSAIHHFSEIPALSWGVASGTVAVSSVGLVVANIGLGGVIWGFLLKDNGVTIRWKKILAIFSIAQLGKYLPGNVGQHVGRVIMGRENGIPLPIILNTMLVEILWGASVAADLALLSLLLFIDGQALDLRLLFGPVQLGLGAAILLFTPWLAIGFLNKYLPGLAKRLSGGGKITPPKSRTALWVVALFLLCLVVMGLILKLQAQWIFGVTASSVFELTCLLSIAWLAGYLVPGAPGGLGIREAMMVLLLTPVLGAGPAVGLSMTLRVTTTVGDAMAFLLGLLLKRFDLRAVNNFS